jgi:hypothetical protein
MAAQVGDRIIVESQKVGRAAREGEIIEASYGTRYRVRWDDGPESTIRPAAGSARTTPPAERNQVEGPIRKRDRPGAGAPDERGRAPDDAEGVRGVPAWGCLPQPAVLRGRSAVEEVARCRS